MTTELGPVGREEQLAVLRKRMRRAARRGEAGELKRLTGEYEVLKAAHVVASHAEMKVAMRARRAAEQAQEAAVGSARWKLPAGFGTSPLAAERAREPRRGGAVQVPAGGLRPWRRGSLMGTRIWRP